MCRNFYRCVDCLSVMAVEGELPRTYEPRSSTYQYAQCGACDGQVEHMGKVSGQHITMRHLCCPCDTRCTHALGPNCECQCGGENHGTQLVVPVDKVVGGLPRVTPRSYLAAREVAREYREALAPFQARRTYLRSLGWIEGHLYRELCDLGHALARVHKARTHTGRMKILRALAPVHA